MINIIFNLLFIRLLNKKESVDQAHVYVPPERKPKFEETPRCLGQKINEISSNVESKNEIIKEPINDQQKSMDVELNVDSAVVKDQPINMSIQKNDAKIIEKNIKPTLSNEDLKNFKNSISYVSQILYNILFFQIFFIQ